MAIIERATKKQEGPVRLEPITDIHIEDGVIIIPSYDLLPEVRGATQGEVLELLEGKRRDCKPGVLLKENGSGKIYVDGLPVRRVFVKKIKLAN